MMDFFPFFFYLDVCYSFVFIVCTLVFVSGVFNTYEGTYFTFGKHTRRKTCISNLKPMWLIFEYWFQLNYQIHFWSLIKIMISTCIQLVEKNNNHLIFVTGNIEICSARRPRATILLCGQCVYEDWKQSLQISSIPQLKSG